MIDSIFAEFRDDKTSTLMNSKFGFWFYSLENNSLTFSQEAKKILGNNETDWDSHTKIRSRIIENERFFFDRFFITCFRQKKSKSAEFKCLLDGKGILIKCRVEYEANMKQIIGVINDNTEFRKEYSLIDRKIDLSSKIERITKTGSFEWNLKEETLVCSDNFFHITQTKGHNRNNRLNKSIFFNLIDTKSQNFVLDVMHESVIKNKEFEVVFYSSSSNKKKFKLYGQPQGSLTSKRLIGVIVDITKQVSLEESVIIGQENERKRLSLELHDSVGQKLIAIKYMVALFNMTKNFEDFGQLNTSMDEIIDEIRQITHNLSNQIVAEVGLKNSVNQLLNECAKALNAEKFLNYELPETLTIDEKEAKMIYRIVQEALSNAMKYSSAEKLTVSIKYQNKQINLEIEDDGVGFDLNSLNSDGIGLQNIKQRVNFLNGFLKIDSNKSKGTSIKVNIPMKN